MSCSSCYQITCLKPANGKLHTGNSSNQWEPIKYSQYIPSIFPVYSQYIPSIFPYSKPFQAIPSPKGPKISNPQPQGPRVPGTGQGGYDMDLVFRQEIGQRLLPRLQQHLKRWAINVGGRNKTWRGCEGWEYLCTSLYIYMYYISYSNKKNENIYMAYIYTRQILGFCLGPATTTMSHMIVMIKIIMTIIRKNILIHIYTYASVCVKSHIQNMPHIYILTSSHVYIYLYTSHLVCLSKCLQKEKPRDRQVAAIDDREFTLLALLWNRIHFTSWTMGIAVGFVDGLWESPRNGVKMVGFYS